MVIDVEAGLFKLVHDAPRDASEVQLLTASHNADVFNERGPDDDATRREQRWEHFFFAIGAAAISCCIRLKILL